MRRYVTIGSIVVATVLAGSAAAYGEPERVVAAPAAGATCPSDAVVAAPAPVPPVAPAAPAAPVAPAVPDTSGGPPSAAPLPDPATPAPAPVSALRPAAAVGEPASDDQGEGDQGETDQPAAAAPSDPPSAAAPSDPPAAAAPSDPPAATGPAVDPGATPSAGSSDPACGPDTSAATKYGWGTPNRVDEFDSGLGPDWDVYDGEGHDGQGRRTPDAVSVKDGIMTITGDAQGDTAGMAWNQGQKYGRWEGRVRAPVGDPTYNALMLLWPDAEDWPVGGEVDFMEMSDDKRQSTDMFLHYGASNDQEQGSVDIDATQWHDWALEWTPTSITAFVDGKQWWTTTNVDILPPGPMHLCIQLDWFPEGRGDVTPTRMQVAWVKQYPLNGDAAKEGAVAGLVPRAVAVP